MSEHLRKIRDRVAFDWYVRSDCDCETATGDILWLLKRIDELETERTRVEMEGSAREVYIVRASSPQDAMDRWVEGAFLISEVYGMTPVSAEIDDDDETGDTQ